MRLGLGRVERGQLADRVGGGLLGVGGHLLHGAQVVVERHDVDHADRGAVGDRVLQDRRLLRVEPGGGARHRVGELDAAPVRLRPGLDHRDRLVAPVDAGRVGQRVRLDVQVDTGHVVGGDHLLVDGGDAGDVGATVGDVGAGGVGRVAAEGWDDLAACRLDLGDLDAVGGVRDRLAGAAVPV